MKKLGVFAICALLGLMILPSAGAQSYTLTDLGTLGGVNGSEAFAVNDTGWVVGNSYIPTEGDSQVDAFLWTPGGHMHDLGLGASTASSINNSGQVVGAVGAGYTSAFIWTRSAGLLSLGTLGGNSSGATSINVMGEVVGFSTLSPNDDRTTHPFLWTATGGMQDLGTLGGKTANAIGINNKGTVVGTSYLSDDQTCRPFVWTASGGMRDIGTLGGSSSNAYAVNDSGEVVGSSYLPGDTLAHAFLWTRSTGMRDLGSLGGFSTAVGINNSEQVVGYATAGAFLWTRSRGMENLSREIPPQSGWRLFNALGINNAGQVVGGGTFRNQPRGYLLTPNTSASLEDSKAKTEIVVTNDR